MDYEKKILPLRDYQVADLSFYMRAPRSLVLSDPATGKTASVCVYAFHLWENLGEKSAWAMPKSLLKKNFQELLEFTPFTEDDLVIVDGTKVQRNRLMSDRSKKVFLMGFDCYSNNWEYLLEQQPEVNALLVDEIHMGFGGSTSKRTANMIRSMSKVEKYLGMTGTLIDGKLSSAYPSIHVINSLYYSSYEGFMLEHAITDNYGNVVAWRNTEKIKKILGRHAIRHTFEEIYGPEAKVIIPEVVDMAPKQYEAYKEFESQALLELKSDWLDGTIPAVHAIRCRQIMAHPHTFELMNEGELTGKDERLVVHLEDHKQSRKPLIIFAALVPEQERIARIVRSMGMKVGLINGSVSAKDRAIIDQKFCAGEIQVIVGSPATAAVGWNWMKSGDQIVDTMIFVSVDYKDSSFIQAYRRAIRGQRKTPLLIYVLRYAESAVEDRILDIIEEKSKLASSVDETKEVLSLRVEKKKKVERRKVTRLSMADLL